MSWSCSFSQLRYFLCRQANEAVTSATGVDVLGKYNEGYVAISHDLNLYPTKNDSPCSFVSCRRYQMGAMGMHVDPAHAVDQKIDTLGQRFSGADAAGRKLRATPKERLVTSVEEFIALRDRAAKAPIGGAVALVHALLVCANPATRTLGDQLLVLSVAEDCLVRGTTYKGYALKEDLASQLSSALEGEGTVATLQAALASLVAGTSPQTGYGFDPAAVVLTEDVGASAGDDPRDGLYTAHLMSTGADYPRSVTLSVNKNGVWKVRDFGDLLAEVASPPVTLTAADEL
jgi:hypothetical protein